MTEPKRLLDDPPNALAASLLTATLHDHPSSSRAMERTAATLGVSALMGTALASTSSTAAAATAAGAGSVAASSSVAGASGGAVATGSTAVGVAGGTATEIGAGVLTKWLLIGSISTASVVGGAALVVDAQTPGPTTNTTTPGSASVEVATRPGRVDARPRPEPRVAVSRSPAPAPAPTLTAAPEITTETAPETASSPPQRGVAATQKDEPPGGPRQRSRSLIAQAVPQTTSVPSAAFPAVQPTPSIADEIALLDRARAELAGREPRAALATLDVLERGGEATLGPEARIVRIEAILQLGDRARAASLARRFLAAYPQSAHAPRLEEIIAQSH